MKQVLIAIDQLFNALLGGWSDETLSAKCWRERHERMWPVRVIDTLFFWEHQHCKQSCIMELRRAHLPKVYTCEDEE